jgi:hypothetical protein
VVTVTVGVAYVVAEVAPCATPLSMLIGVVVFHVPVVTAITHPAHFRAVPIVQVNTSPPTAVFRTTSTENTVPLATLRTSVDPDGRADGAVPFDAIAMPMSKSPATNPAGIAGENEVAVADPEFPTPMDRTVGGTGHAPVMPTNDNPETSSTVTVRDTDVPTGTLSVTVDPLMM